MAREKRIRILEILFSAAVLGGAWAIAPGLTPWAFFFVVVPGLLVLARLRGAVYTNDTETPANRASGRDNVMLTGEDGAPETTSGEPWILW